MDHVPVVRSARKAMCNQMTAMFLNQWRLHAHICENFNPHKNGTEVAGKVWPDDCTGCKFCESTMTAALPACLPACNAACLPACIGMDDYYSLTHRVVALCVPLCVRARVWRRRSLGCTSRHDLASRRGALVSSEQRTAAAYIVL